MATRVISLIFFWGFLFVNFQLCQSQIPCDEAYGKHCPESAGWEVVKCLKSVDVAENPLDTGCVKFINMHDSCETEIKQHCNGNEFTGDVTPCLSEWTSKSLLSQTCIESLPEKVKQDKKKASKEEEKRASQRRRVRNTAARMARDL